MKSDLSPIFVTHTPCPRESDGDQGQSPGFPRLARSQAQKSGRAGDKIPRKGGSDNTKSDPPGINFIVDRGMLPEHEVPPGEPDADNTTQTNVFLPVQPIRC